ncbi:hypothetical protein ACNKHK_05225 [Shigella flexneri]
MGDDVVAAIERRAKEGDFRSNLHRGGVASICEYHAARKRNCAQSRPDYGLDVAGVDILRADRGPLVMEVNTSPGLEGVEKTTGIDIAGKMIQWINVTLRLNFALKSAAKRNIAIVV